MKKLKFVYKKKKIHPNKSTVKLVKIEFNVNLTTLKLLRTILSLDCFLRLSDEKVMTKICFKNSV